MKRRRLIKSGGNAAFLLLMLCIALLPAPANAAGEHVISSITEARTAAEAETPSPAGGPSFLTGSGSADDPWLISSEAGLTQAYQMMLDEGCGDHYLLTADIALTKPLDNSFIPEGGGVVRTGASQAQMTGTFDGGGHTISNVKINSTANEGGGFSFFEYNSGTIRDLNLVYAEGYTYTGYDPVWGGIVDFNSGTVSNCTVTGSVTIGIELDDGQSEDFAAFGLIAGYSYDGAVVTGCTASGTLTGPDGCTAGLVGGNYGVLSGCTDLVSVNGHPPVDSPAAAGEITVTLDGQPIVFDQPPIVENNRTLVPMRAIFEAMGAEVYWDGATQTASAVRHGVTVRIQLGSNIMYRNDAAIDLDVPAKAVNGRTLVPVRAVSEAFNAQVEWEPSSMRVSITTPG